MLSGLTLLGLSALADRIQRLVWTWLPHTLGLSSGTGVPGWWIIGVLTVTGISVGATIRWIPGHAGNDPATTGLVAPPLAIGVLPGLALALVLGLAGGVSLGPENPIIAVNVALAVWMLTRRQSGAGAGPAITLATAGTIGALFATPLAAALVLTETLAARTATSGQRLFDLLFPPLVAAAAGAITMDLAGAPTFSISVGAYDHLHGWDLLSAPLVAIAGALLVAIGAFALPHLHILFHRLPDPIVALGTAGLLLGVLGAIGGQITLFKGLDQMKELADTAADRTWGGLTLIAAIKLVALVIATAAGFRGGRIFPSVFIGVAIGLAAVALIPAIPPAVAVSAGTLGAVIAVDQDGWIALFLAAITVGQITLLPLLCLTLAPLWLVARVLPPFEVAPPPSDQREFGQPLRTRRRLARRHPRA